MLEMYKRLAAFSILMENGNGLVGKAPNYINEKYHSVMLVDEEWQLEALLDQMNQNKYRSWKELWGLT